MRTIQGIDFRMLAFDDAIDAIDAIVALRFEPADAVEPGLEQTERIDLHLRLTEEGWRASMNGYGEWAPEGVGRDVGFRRRLAELNRLGYQPLPTDESGLLGPVAAGFAGQMQALAQQVGATR